jgi:hypothetical protein
MSGGLVVGPTTGAIVSDGAESTSSRLNDLQIQISQKHRLFGPDLPQLFVGNLF